MIGHIRHGVNEFKPKRPSQKIDRQRLAWRRANHMLADILSAEDPFWRTMQVRAYLGILEAAHAMGTAGSLLTHTAVTIHIVLTDGEHIHDRRIIHPGDLGRLNEAAQRETKGKLWWEIRPFDV